MARLLTSFGTLESSSQGCVEATELSRVVPYSPALSSLSLVNSPQEMCSIFDIAGPSGSPASQR